MFCSDPEEGHAGWVREVKEEGIYIYLQLIHFAVQHKHDIVEQLDPPPPPKGKSQSEECPWMFSLLTEAS